MSTIRDNREDFKKILKSKNFPNKFIEKFVEINIKDMCSIEKRMSDLMKSDYPQYEAIMHLVSILGMLAYFCNTQSKLMEKTYENDLMQFDNKIIQSFKDFLKHLKNLELMLIEFSCTFFQYLNAENK